MPKQRFPSRWSRRELLKFAAAGASMAAIGGLSARAEATVEAGILDRFERGARGTTLYFTFQHSMFPCAGHGYTDGTVIIYVPHYFELRDERIDTVVHFHGHMTTAADAMESHQLREQLVDSLQNAVLVMPQGPVRAADSSGGKLDQTDGLINFLTEVRKSLTQLDAVDEALGDTAITGYARIGLVCLSAHSGGYRVAARCLQNGNYEVNEVYLLDALYGELQTYYDWVAETSEVFYSRERHKLVSFYQGNGDVKDNNHTLMQLFDQGNVSYVHEEADSPITRGEFTRSRAVIIEANASHQGVAFAQNSLRDCLFSSCLSRNIETEWFDDVDNPRAIDERTPE